MTNEERELIMRDMSGEQRDRYRQILRELGSKLKIPNGRRLSLKELIDSGKISVPEELRPAIEAFAERDAMGPEIGAPAIDFCLKRLDGEEYVRLSDFKNKRPVALIFGSYT